MNVDLSLDQKTAFEAIMAWLKKPNQQFITLGGYAGTGKTTLLATLAEKLNEDYPKMGINFCAYTGKAARVLTNALKEVDSPLKNSVSTIHSLIYSAISDERGNIVGWRKKEELTADLIIVDEASMVSESIWNDLLSYGKLILAVGDHGQLPPIGTNFNLMATPQLRLETIHRQVEGHPIIHLSMLARETGLIPPGKYSDKVVKLARTDSFVNDTISELLDSYNTETLLLCGYNKTRVGLNKGIRARREFYSETPEVGDRVICLKNNHQIGIFNGLVGAITELERVDKNWFLADIEFDDEDRLYHGYILADQFGQLETMKELPLNPEKKKGDLFDFGYATTVHKAQGSQADKVIVFEERFSKSSEEDWRRWLYTAVTRARNELYLIGD